MKLAMNPDDAKLLQEFIEIGNSIPCDMGRFLFSYTFMPSMTSGHISFLLDWKRENGEADFRNLQDGIKELKWVKSRVEHYKTMYPDGQ